MAILKNCTMAMHNLGLYYEQQQDYENMIKYYKMTIQNNNIIINTNINIHTNAMKNLSNYYEKQKDYENMIIYALQTIDNDCYDLISNIIDYYILNDNHEKIIYYYWMSLDCGNINLVINFIDYLIKCKSNVKIIYEIYYICYNNEKYNDQQLKVLKEKIGLQNIQITKYIELRSISINKLIKIYINIDEICNLIHNY
jgi:tetratricopeptide (TPR) repeat protein